MLDERENERERERKGGLEGKFPRIIDSIKMEKSEKALHVGVRIPSLHLMPHLVPLGLAPGQPVGGVPQKLFKKGMHR